MQQSPSETSYKWNANKVLEQWLAKAYKGNTYERPIFKHPYECNHTFTISELKRLKLIAAHLVQELGEQYLEYYQFIEKHLKTKKAQQRDLQDIQRLLSSDNILNGKSNLFKP